MIDYGVSGTGWLIVRAESCDNNLGIPLRKNFGQNPDSRQLFTAEK